MKQRKNMLIQLINKQKSRSDIEKDIHNPIRRVVRHTILKKKHGNMMQYHSDACNYYCNQTVDIEQVIASAKKETEEYLEEQAKKREEKAKKKAEHEAEVEKRKAEKEAKKAETEAKKNEEIKEEKSSFNFINLNVFKKKNKPEETSDVKSEQITDDTNEESKQTAESIGVDAIDNNPSVKKGEDGLYHYCPIIIKDEIKEETEESSEQSDQVEESEKVTKEPKVPQDKKPATKKGTKSKKK